MVSLGQALCTSDLAFQVLVRLVKALDATEADFTAEDFSPIITGLTEGSTDFSGTAMAVQAEVVSLEDGQCPRPLCWVVAVSPFLTTTATDGEARMDSDVLSEAGALHTAFSDAANAGKLNDAVAAALDEHYKCLLAAKTPVPVPDETPEVPPLHVLCDETFS